MAYVVSSGDVESGIILENDTMTALDGGTATITTVNSNGKLYDSLRRHGGQRVPFDGT